MCCANMHLQQILSSFSDGQSTSMLKGCMDTCLILSILPLSLQLWQSIDHLLISSGVFQGKRKYSVFDLKCAYCIFHFADLGAYDTYLYVIMCSGLEKTKLCNNVSGYSWTNLSHVCYLLTLLGPGLKVQTSFVSSNDINQNDIHLCMHIMIICKLKMSK